MTKQVINLGTAPTGTGGDTPRTAFTKAQANFDELYSIKAASGANSDITSLSGLTTALSVAQGGTGRNDGLAWGNLKGTLSSQADLQAALDAKSGFGVGQAWTDVTSSRVLGTTYTNTTGKPIQVTLLVGPSSGTDVATIVKVGSSANLYGSYSASSGRYINNAPLVVPVGSTYSVSVINGTAAIVSWSELR